MKHRLTRFLLHHWTIFSAGVLLLGAAWILLNVEKSDLVAANNMAFPKAGFPAPDFELDNLDSQSIRLSELRGTPVVLNFWATWCQPCRIEMPAIQKARNSYQNDELVILAVNMTDQDSLDQVHEFVNRYNLTFDILLDENGKAASAYRVSALPSTFFIGADGTIDEVVIGGPMSEALLLSRIEKLMDSR